MSRIQMACYCLVASAFVLAALLIAKASAMVESKAYAEMVVHKDIVTMISTRLRADSECVYVLDSKQERLMCYLVDPNRNVIELLPGGVLDVGKTFEAYLRANQPNKGPLPKKR